MEISTLTLEQAHHLLESIWQSKMTYPFPVTFLSEKKLAAIQIPFMKAIVPKLGYNRNMATEIRYGPGRYGGCSIAWLFTEQGIAAIKQFIGHVRAEDELGDLMLILLDHLQLRAGTSWPILSNCSVEIPHLHKLSKEPYDWILAIRSFLHTCDGSMEVADAWVPPLQREGDVHIMDVLNDGTATAAELSLANEFRMHKRVVTLADIVDVSGKSIMPEGLDDSISPSSLRFGKQAPPSDRAGQTWRRLIRRRFASGIPPHTRHSHGFLLDIALGPWSQDSPRHLTYAWSFCPKTDVLYRASYDEQQQLQYRLYRPQVYRTEKYYRTDEVTDAINPRFVPVETIDFLEYVRIRGGAPINKQMAIIPPATFEEHVHRLPEHLQRIIGRSLATVCIQFFVIRPSKTGLSSIEREGGEGERERSISTCDFRWLTFKIKRRLLGLGLGLVCGISTIKNMDRGVLV